MMPDVERIVFIDREADAVPTAAPPESDVVERTAQETGPAEAIEADASPDARSAPEPATTDGSSLTRVPGPHDRVRKIVAPSCSSRRWCSAPRR